MSLGEFFRAKTIENFVTDTIILFIRPLKCMVTAPLLETLKTVEFYVIPSNTSTLQKIFLYIEKWQIVRGKNLGSLQLLIPTELKPRNLSGLITKCIV